MTKSLRVAVSMLLLMAAAAFAQTDAQKAFKTIKNMPGSWEGITSDGKAVQVTFKQTSGGSAVMSEITGKEDMVTMFHLDGPNKLIATHYCMAGNQPRMQAGVSSDGKVLTFNFVDATNLASPDAGHMQSLVITVIDDNHHTEEWTFADHGKEIKRVFDLHRKS